jgi:hypothetical protein
MNPGDASSALRPTTVRQMRRISSLLVVRTSRREVRRPSSGDASADVPRFARGVAYVAGVSARTIRSSRRTEAATMTELVRRPSVHASESCRRAALRRHSP